MPKCGTLNDNGSKYNIRPVMDSNTASTVRFTAIDTSEETKTDPDAMTVVHHTVPHGQNDTESKLRNPIHPCFHEKSSWIPIVVNKANGRTVIKQSLWDRSRKTVKSEKPLSKKKCYVQVKKKGGIRTILLPQTLTEPILTMAKHTMLITKIRLYPLQLKSLQIYSTTQTP